MSNARTDIFASNLLSDIKHANPVYLVMFDLADTKGRNIHIGVNEVNKDIDIFRNLLSMHFDTIYRSFPGNWFVLSTVINIDVLQNVISSYVESRSIYIGWKCIAKRDNEIVSSEEKKLTEIRRAVRCAYLYIDTSDDISQRLDYATSKLKKLSVNSVHNIDQSSEEDIKWKCITDEDTKPIYCPVCKGTIFTWTDGAEDSATGNCCTCLAEVDFRYF